jgi:metallophosphoesterase (TIGR03767 family)
VTGRSQDGLTTRRTLVRGPADSHGWRPLVEGPGEPHREQAPDGPVLACLWHLSDLHVCDAESPARLEYLDRYSDPDSPYREALGDIGTYRPQEALTVQVAVSMVETVNRTLTGPVTGASIDATLLTGDLTDNAQRNELAWYQRIVEGGTITPRSGDLDRSSWVGATDDRSWDERYWHPDGPPAGREPDRPTRIFGFPTLPGLVAAARREVHSPGLELPWVSVHGNHDGLLQGTVAVTEDLRALARGTERIVGLPAGATPDVVAEAIAEIGPARYVHDSTSPRLRIVDDEDREPVRPGEFAAVTRDASDGGTYFTRDVGGVRLMCLDTVNPHGGWQGSLDEGQYAWLVDQLDSARRSGRRVVIASHHPSFTLTNDFSPAGAASRVLGSEVVAALLESGVVIAWVAGHVHFNSANRHGDARRGFWEITTSSLIDWPQQARILEFVLDETSGEVAVVSTVVDHHAPPGWSERGLEDHLGLASVSRALAANDYRLREGTLRGLMLESSADQRNTVWRSPDPLVR